jgi:glycogen debranching enzyme
MPLYSGAVSKSTAQALVAQLTDHRQFWLNHVVPSVPMHSRFFNPVCYWQGPVWINTNWLIVEGLKRYGYHDIARQIAEASIALVAAHGPAEYFSPIDAKPLGNQTFSWTAALTLDFIDQVSNQVSINK